METISGFISLAARAAFLSLLIFVLFATVTMTWSSLMWMRYNLLVALITLAISVGDAYILYRTLNAVSYPWVRLIISLLPFGFGLQMGFHCVDNPLNSEYEYPNPAPKAIAAAVVCAIIWVVPAHRIL